MTIKNRIKYVPSIKWWQCYDGNGTPWLGGATLVETMDIFVRRKEEEDERRVRLANQKGFTHAPSMFMRS